MSNQALSPSRRESRAVRLRLRRDWRRGRWTSPSVVLPSGFDLPPAIGPYPRAPHVRGRAGGKAFDLGVEPRQPGPGDGLRRAIKATPTGASRHGEPVLAYETKSDAAAAAFSDDSANHPVRRVSVPAAAAPVTPSSNEAAEAEHSGHVTLYLPKDLYQWLAQHHDASQVSYPEILLNAISWAVEEKMLPEIFAPLDSRIPANDIFGRAQMITRPSRRAEESETRPLRFRRDHMQIIIRLARIWTAGNRNAFFVGVLAAYRDHKIGRPAD